MRKLLFILFVFACENTIVDSSSSSYGCIDESACNYDSDANSEDGSCAYEEDCTGECGGSAVVDDCSVCDGDGSTCIYGCTDESACNYDDGANADDGSCQYYDLCGVCDGDGSTCINYEVVINEINYNSSSDFNTGDWVELYNPNDVVVEMNLWEFKDGNNNVFTFPENQEMPPWSYLVLCNNLDLFSPLFPDVTNIVGDFDFGLSGAGEQVKLFNSDGELVDMLVYDDTSPWPIEPDGDGPTLELIDPSLDNALGENWAASNNNGGTPGKINSVIDE